MLTIKRSGKQGFSTISTTDYKCVEPRGPNPAMPYELGDSIAIPFSHYNRDGTMALDSDFGRCVLGVYVEAYDELTSIIVHIQGTMYNQRTAMMACFDKKDVINLTAYERLDKAIDKQLTEMYNRV